MTRMRLLWCLLVTCALASEDEGRAKKQPIVVDAVGNTLPPPSNVPATVGSPVNLLTPDRYEFYTFDESGELVKRLMTLEEIQAIVAAGEEAEGLVTFANDNQPTMAFNFSQPSHNKVHSVVTNVQNVLKAQMEAHKNNPVAQPTLDTPDVSDSWSLILPSIFGNTGLDIVPDKIPNIITPPETDTLEFNDSSLDVESMSKEGVHDISSNTTTTKTDDSVNPVLTSVVPLTEEIKTTPLTITSTMITTTKKNDPITTTPSPTTSTTVSRPTSTTTIKTTTITTTKPTRITTTTIKSSTAKVTTARPITKLPTLTLKDVTTPITVSSIITSETQDVSTTTKLPSIVTNKIRATTSKPKTTSPQSTSFITTSVPKSTSTLTVEKYISKLTTSKPLTTKKQHIVSTTTPKIFELNKNIIEVLNNNTDVEKNTVQYEKISTLIPISTVTATTEKTTPKLQTSKPIETSINGTTIIVSSTTESINTSSHQSLGITTYKPTTKEFDYISSTAYSQDLDKSNTTTVTTQSVSPSTTVSSTEFITVGNIQSSDFTGNKPVEENLGNINNEPDIPLFDVAQSISQIASDLGGSYMPLPTVSNLLDTTKLNQIDLESKENFEMEIMPDNVTKNINISDNNTDNFVKISTIDPHDRNINNVTIENKIHNNSEIQAGTTESNIMTSFESTTMDKILSESMGDLLSQVVNEAPQTVQDSGNNVNSVNKVTTTEKNPESTTSVNFSETITTTSAILQTNVESEKSENDIPSLEKTTSLVMYSTTETSEIVNSKTNLPEKNQIKEDQTYVKISEIKDKNESIFMIPEKTISLNNMTLINEDNKTESLFKNTSKITMSNTTTSPLLNNDSATLSNISLEPLFSNKTKHDKNESSIINTNDNTTIKITDSLPKIEDFKKKIQKVNIDDKELVNERNNSWKLISTVSPPKVNVLKDKLKNNVKNPLNNNSNKDIVLDFSKENQGLEVTTKDLEEDIAKFSELCNELAFRYWNTIIENIDKRRSFVLSPYSITSMLAMMFMGARGATSGEMNDILKLDDMVTFNPHFTLKNISDSIETTPQSGVMVSAFIRELYSDRSKGKILTFYKERAQQFYNGHVEEINFKLISDIIRRRTNLLVKRYTWGKISEYMKTNTITMQPPLAAFSANIFQTDCTGSSVEGRDGEMYFVVSPTVRQRRLVPVPAVVYRGGFLAGYDPVLDATAAALGNTNSIISTLFVMPGQQGNIVHAEDLETLEQRLLDANPSTPSWNRLLRTLLPRVGLELQIPRFSHKSIFNISSTLRYMGLKDLFDADHADLGGLNGPSKDLYLSDMIQSTTFVTCGEDVIGEQHHVEEYPESVGNIVRRRSSRWAPAWDEPRDYQRAFHDPHDVGEAMHLPLHLRPRQARLPSRNAQPARLKFDRPFLYFVRHNPSGMILYVGRYNPRLLP
ncbi:unnamed protein product [Diatraea saccharalis]|uniref:Serpin domain-containing protein n=1 Tax=Diatraea saccharalis TaxID=40085 RepID=A0A9N9R2A3_9NEOP|nr:unnamed protein product [Diatraea saccharalis]